MHQSIVGQQRYAWTGPRQGQTGTVARIAGERHVIMRWPDGNETWYVGSHLMLPSMRVKEDAETEWAPEYSKWRHGGWYVTNVRYPNGAVGCISRNYPDGKWRIVGETSPEGHARTYPTRDAAARAERDLAGQKRTEPAP